MGRANKNTTTHTDGRYYRAIGGDEKVHKGALNVRYGNRSGIDNLDRQYKKSIFSQRDGFLVWIIQANWYIVQRRKQHVMHRPVYWV